MAIAFQSDAFQIDAFQIDSGLVGDAFQCDAFQTSGLAFQTSPCGGVPVPAPGVPLASDVGIWLGGYDLTGAISAVNLQASRAAFPMTQMGDDLEGAQPGRESVVSELIGFWQSDLDAIEAARVLGGDFSEWPLTFLPPLAPTATAGADGNAAYNVRSAQFGISFGGQHGELLPFRLASRPRTGLLDRMTVMLPKTTYVASATGTARQLGAVGSGQKLVAVLHVFAVTGGTWTVTIESDVTPFATPTTIATFTGATGITRQVIDISGPITDDWFRAVLTKSGGTSCVAAVLLARTQA